jgi:hypothetical protein
MRINVDADKPEHVNACPADVNVEVGSPKCMECAYNEGEPEPRVIDCRFEEVLSNFRAINGGKT